ncbi:MAG TPA: LLM class flavin-dependent oxidoreductase [Ktedonobacteraceae bacterium]|jgi:alkanesulfonate monooxygenase SsuD/methylene tetrahydromethanopterin reductase-like flavin-dependent oxidoreductase (luciferase family)|nr:LLM class flavin-dependent oxidoreductase [Ktedonobacteraceae bacterium]
MKFGLDIPTTGVYADVHVLAKLAAEAESVGWDGFFVWDVPSGIDPWLALTAIAMQTSRIKIGFLALPLPRHRPWLVAKRLADLDQLSQGRVICTVGLGDSDSAFASYGEESAPIIRAKKLDEGLEILTGLWMIDSFSFTGEYYQLHQVRLASRPIQSPRIPLWTVGGWPRRPPFRRAAQWDGICFKSIHHETGQELTLGEFRSGLAYVRAHRRRDTPFDVIMSGETPLDRQRGIDIVLPFQEAGATWWMEEGYSYTSDLEAFRTRIRSGPPRSGSYAGGSRN